MTSRQTYVATELVLQVVALVPLRMADKDMALDGGRVLVPKGTVVWASQIMLHRSSALWADHDKFRPERWMDPDAEYFDKDRGIRKFIPFSDGQ